MPNTEDKAPSNNDYSLEVELVGSHSNSSVAIFGKGGHATERIKPSISSTNDNGVKYVHETSTGNQFETPEPKQAF